jgi:hypothetical protein
MGVDADELADLGIDDLTEIVSNDLTEPEAAMDAIEAAIEAGRIVRVELKAGPGESDGAYVLHEGNWRERHGLSRKRKSVPPSRTPEARRARHIAARASRLGISIADAERVTRRRLSARRKP